jgi:hypothetical protein
MSPLASAELEILSPPRFRRRMAMLQPDHKFYRGLKYGLAFSLVIWAVIGLIAYLLWR